MKLHLFIIIVIFSLGINLVNGQTDNIEIPSICSTSSTLELDGKGTASSLTLALTSTPGSITIPPIHCSVRIKAPSTHFIYVRLIDTEQEKLLLEQQQQQPQEQEEERLFEVNEKVQAGRRVHSKRNGINIHGCPVSVYQSEPIRINSTNLIHGPWSADACALTVPTDGVLFTNDVHISWVPPIATPTKAARERNARLLNRKLIITALGKGDMCHSKDQHVCIKISWTPLLCVASDLLCDGTIHCPPGGLLGDENPQFCKDRTAITITNWERLAQDFLKKLSTKGKSGSFIPAIQKDNNKWGDNWKNSEFTTANNNNNDNGETDSASSEISSALSSYGPWGYLMLGMLICGTVLTFCGLWECCCKPSKPHHHLESTPTASTIAGSVIPSTVLVLGSDTHTEGSAPPNYEDLDQPPSYNTLFPNQKEVEAAIQIENQTATVNIPSEEVTS